VKNTTIFATAFEIFKHSTLNESGVGDTINLSMVDMAEQVGARDLIEQTSQLVSDAVHSGQRVWLCSDLHFCHRNIVDYSDRPFTSLTQMNSSLLALLHKVPEDEILILAGDVAMGDYEEAMAWLKKIQRRVILVVGNHDMSRGDGRYRYKQERNLFKAVVPFLFWEEPGMGRLALVTHYPITIPPSVHAGAVINYHGHLHQKLLQRTAQIHYVNVGYDVAHGLAVL
jgi:calcineurin-like phosphoesterase family protein